MEMELAACFEPDREQTCSKVINETVMRALADWCRGCLLLETEGRFQIHR